MFRRRLSCRIRKQVSAVTKVVGLALLLGIVLAPRIGWACACGCGVFDVGTGLMLPEGAGGMVYVDYDYQDQDQNWHGTSPAPAANNGDKEIRTHFVTARSSVHVRPQLGFQVEVPYDDRYFKTTGGPLAMTSCRSTGPVLATFESKASTRGFHRICRPASTSVSSCPQVIIPIMMRLATSIATRNSGREAPISSRRLPSGESAGDNSLTWFTQALLDLPVISRNEYRPGLEVDAAAGIYYKGWLVHTCRDYAAGTGHRFRTDQ